MTPDATHRPPLTLDAYWMGRDKLYAKDCTDEVRANAAETVRRANLLLADFYEARPKAATRGVHSGWRPAAVNAKVPGAAKKSNHMLGKAVDLADDDGSLDAWCTSPAGLASMERHGLWLESPAATPRWTHVQTVAPRSGVRVFNP